MSKVEKQDLNQKRKPAPKRVKPAKGQAKSRATGIMSQMLDANC